jgi:hypothetical protein
MMGLDWLSTPPPQVPKSMQTVRAPAKPVAPPAAKKPAKVVASAKDEIKKSEPKPPTATIGAASPASGPKAAATSALAKSDAGDAAAQSAVKQPGVAMVSPETAGSAPAGAVDNPQANGPDGTLGIMTNDGGARGATAQAPAPRCDIQACAQRYISFDASDCTYQPFDGPRRLCTAGNPPGQAGATPAGVQTSDATKPAVDATKPSARSSCNYDACGDAYRSFDPATCTWQPFEGPRQLCTK